jgi:hypothetical protein
VATIFLLLMLLTDRDVKGRAAGRRESYQVMTACGSSRLRPLRPSAFAELVLRPETAEEFEARGGLVAVGVGRREDDGDDVVAARRVGEAEQSEVGACGARDLTLLAKVYVGLGRGEPTAPRRLRPTPSLKFAATSS